MGTGSPEETDGPGVGVAVPPAASREEPPEPPEPLGSHSDLWGPPGLRCVGKGRGVAVSHKDTGGSWDWSDILCPKPGACGMT